MDRAFRYAEDVEKGNITVNHLTKLMVKRFRRDLKDKRFEFREDMAQLAINFTELLRFSKGKKAGERIIWDDWQIFILANIFGFYRKDNGKRRFRYMNCEVARKNGKSTFLAAIGLTFLIIFDEAVPELYVGASTEAQAKPVFSEMKRMVARLRKDYHDLDDQFLVFNKSIEFMENEGIVTMITANADTKDGLSPFMTILDEIHAHKNADLFNVFKSGMGGRDNNTPFIAMITTAGFSLACFGFQIRKNFIQVLEGYKTDESTFIAIYSLDKDDDINDREMWKKANPSLGSALDPYYIEDEFQQAKNFPAQLNNFLTKHLNKWVGSVETWIERPMLDANDGRALLDEEIEEGYVYLGLDIGMVKDISALAQVTVFDDGRFHIKMRYYMSENAYRNFLAMGIPMDIWRDSGISINVNPGKVTDTNVIRDDIIDITEALEVEKIGIDRWSSHQIVKQLEDEGVIVEGVGQGYSSQSDIVQLVEKLMFQERFVLEDDDCLKWMFSNVVLDQSPAGDRKLNKSKADNKIDGISAMFNALFCYNNIDKGDADEGYGIRTLRIG